MGGNEMGVSLDALFGDLANHPSRGSRAIDEAVMVALIERGVSKGVQLAEFFAVSGAAVSKKLKRLQKFVDRSVATSKAGTQLLEVKLLSGERLVALAEQAQKLLDLCGLVVFAPNEYAPEVIEAKNRLRRLVGAKGSVGQMAVALLGESRKQLEFVHEIQKDVFNLKRVQEFQEVVLEEIKAASPEVQQRIMARLDRQQAFRETLDFSGGGAAPARQM